MCVVITSLLTTLSHGIRLWTIVTPPPAPEPLYKVEFNNTSPVEVNLASTDLSMLTQMPASLAPSSVDVIDMMKSDAEMLTDKLDFMFEMYPEGRMFNCPPTPGINPQMIDIIMTAPDVIDPATIHKFMVNAEFCFEGMCDVNVSPYAGYQGYIRLTFTHLETMTP